MRTPNVNLLSVNHRIAFANGLSPTDVRRRMSRSEPHPLRPRVARWRERGGLEVQRGVEIFVVEAGASDAPPLVLFHGFPTSSYDWEPVLEPLAKRFRVLAFDFPGFGLSAKPVDYSYSLFDQCSVAESLFQSRGLDRAHLLCHDMGTSVMTELLARSQDGTSQIQIDSLILLNGSIHFEMADLTLSQRLLRSPLRNFFARVSTRRFFYWQFPKIFSSPELIDRAMLDDLWQLMVREDGKLRLPKIAEYGDERMRHKSRWVGALQKRTEPFLLLWAAEDPVAVRAIGRRLAEECDASVLCELDGVGHYPQLECPDRVVRAVVRWVLEGVREPARLLAQPDD